MIKSLIFALALSTILGGCTSNIDEAEGFVRKKAREESVKREKWYRDLGDFMAGIADDAKDINKTFRDNYNLDFSKNPSNNHHGIKYDLMRLERNKIEAQIYLHLSPDENGTASAGFQVDF